MTPGARFFLTVASRARAAGGTLWLSGSLLALGLALLLTTDLRHASWAAALSAEGSPPPAADNSSRTGYAHGQRQFLGTYERGETYRWIAVTQQVIADGPFQRPNYEMDNVPDGRTPLWPTVQAMWLATVSWLLHLVTGAAAPLAVEQAALWEPVITHVAAFAAVVVFVARRHGAMAAGLAGLVFSVFPLFSAQFLPGVMTTRVGALLFTAGALALHFPHRAAPAGGDGFSRRAAVAAALALWLDPVFGFTAVVLSAAAGVASLRLGGARLPFLRWSGLGAALTLLACLVDRVPWNPAMGELRYVHPLYALAWLGLGLGLHGAQRLRRAETRRANSWAMVAAGVLLLAPLVHAQLTHGYRGWLYSGAALRRLTSLDETRVWTSAFAWLRDATAAEIGLLLAPALATVMLLALRLRARGEPRPLAGRWGGAAVVFIGLLGLSLLHVRWSAVASLAALPLLAALLTTRPMLQRWIAGGTAALFACALIFWSSAPPAHWRRPSRASGPGPAEVEKLVHRHLAHWLAAHHPGERVAALAPPELSDSLVFHGGVRVLMSTAWETYPGQVAASRILSAPENSEAEAVLERLALTHLILPSWDRVLPLLVKPPDDPGKDTLHARLQRWVPPHYLRPFPYPFPAVPGYEDQKLVVFKVTPPQDEALLLSRLTEYFLEVNRPEPARLAAAALAESFAEDPNASIARALAYADGRQPGAFERELTRLVAEVRAGHAPSSWDRRVQRAIVLALGRRPDLARHEVEACLTEATRADLFELTPLQAYRLSALARNFRLSFGDPALTALAAQLGAEYQPSAPPRSSP